MTKTMHGSNLFTYLGVNIDFWSYLALNVADGSVSWCGGAVHIELQLVSEGASQQLLPAGHFATQV
jgi:hypothetical protein